MNGVGGAQFDILDSRGGQSPRECREDEKPSRKERHGAYCCELRIIRWTGRKAGSPRHSAPLAPNHDCHRVPNQLEPSAEDFLRALEVWRAWIAQWRHTGDERALRTAQACEQIAKEKLAIRCTQLALGRSARLARLADRALNQATWISQKPTQDESIYRELQTLV
jgi:hypothetical protein